MNEKRQDAIKLFGLTPDYSQADLQKARRKMLMQYHPDHNNSPDANRITQQINLGYEMLVATAYGVPNNINKPIKVHITIRIMVIILVIIWLLLILALTPVGILFKLLFVKPYRFLKSRMKQENSSPA